MKLEFEKHNGTREYVGNYNNLPETMQAIKEFLKQHSYKSYYNRINWFHKEKKMQIDVGSHTEFFWAYKEPEDDDYDLVPGRLDY